MTTAFYVCDNFILILKGEKGIRTFILLMENKKRINKKELMNRGWWPQIIKKMLPPQKDYDIMLIEQIEQTEKFKSEKIKRENKKQEKIKQRKELELANENAKYYNPANDYPIARELKRHFILNIGEI